jgi:hypothetical protein
MSELGQLLAIDPKTLYYPLKKLINVGLVVKEGLGRSAKRVEATYKLAAKRLEISPTASWTARLKSLRSTLKCAEQEALAAAAATKDCPEVSDSISIMRSPFWLSLEDRRELDKRLNAVVSEFREKSLPGTGSPFIWTSLIAPLLRAGSSTSD